MAANRIRGITIEINGNTTKLSESLKSADSALKNTQNQLKDVDKLLKLDPSNTELLRQKQELLASAVQQTRDRLTQLKEASLAAAQTAGNYEAWKVAYTPIKAEIDDTSKKLKDLKARQKELQDAGQIDTDAYQALQTEISQTSSRLQELRNRAKEVGDEFGHPISPEQYNALQREIAETEHDLHSLESQTTETEQSVEGLANEGDRAGTVLANAGERIKTGFGTAIATAAKAAATALAATTTAVTAFAKSALDTGKQFDQSMSQVAATMGKSADEIQNLRDFAMEMGAKTAFSATQAADALNYMALAGYDAETSMSMLPNVLNLAAAGGMELSAASDMITDSQTALGLSLAETESLVDKMAKAASQTNTSVAQMGDAILTVGGTAKQLAGGTTELNAVLGVLADNSIKASEGGTHLRNIILAMNPTTDAAIGAFNRLGISAYDEEGKLRSLSDVFLEMNAAMQGMTEQEQTVIKSAIFNKTDLAAVDALLSTNAERWGEITAALEDASGAAADMAATQLDNLSGDITLFQSALEGARIVLSDKLTPNLREFVQFATDGLSSVTDAVKQASHMETLVASFQDAEGAMRPIEDLAAELRDTLAGMGETEQQNLIQTLFNTDDIEEVNVLLDASGERFDELAERLSAVDASSVTDSFTAAMDALGPLMDDAIAMLMTYLPRVVEVGGHVLGAIMDGIVSNLPVLADGAIQVATSFAGYLLDALRNALESLGILKPIEDAFRGVGEAFSRIADVIAPLIERVQEWITSAETAQGATSVLESAAILLGDAISTLTGWVADAIEGISDFADWLAEGSTGADVLIAAIAGITAAFGAYQAITFAVTAAQSAMTLAHTALEAAQNGVAAAQALVNAVMNANPFVLVTTLVAGLVAALVVLWNTNEGFRTAVKEIWKTIQVTFTDVWAKIKSVWDSVKPYFEAIWAAIQATFSAVKEVLGAFFSAAWNAIKLVWSAVSGWFANVWNSIKGVFSAVKAVLSGDFEGAWKAIQGVFSGWKAYFVGLFHQVTDAFSNILSYFEQVGSDLLSGIWNGIANKIEWLKSKVTGVIETIKGWFTGESGFDEHSPSKWAQKVGEYVSLGLANGIEAEADESIQATEKMASSVYSTLQQWADRTTKYEQLSLQDQLALWREIQGQFDQETDQWWSAREKVFALEEKVAAEHAQTIKDTYNNLVKSVEYAVKRYGLSTEEQLSRYEAIRDQFERDSEEWLAADEKVFDTRQTLVKEQAQAWQIYYDDVAAINKEIASLEENYQKELANRTQEIFNAYKLFDAIPEAESVSGLELVRNLEGQIDSIERFYANLERLSERGVGDALVDEIRNMGVGASDELEALLQLSDHKLSEYAALFEEKQALANRLATEELAGLRADTDAQIRENLAAIEDLYTQNAPVIGEAFSQGLAAGILSGKDTAVEAAIEVAKAVEEAIREKTETHSPSRVFERIADSGWIGGLIQGVKHGVGRLRSTLAESFDFSDLTEAFSTDWMHNLQALVEAAGSANQTVASGLTPALEQQASSGSSGASVAQYDAAHGQNTATSNRPIYFALYNQLGGRTLAQKQYRYTEEEAVRQGQSLIRVR